MKKILTSLLLVTLLAMPILVVAVTTGTTPLPVAGQTVWNMINTLANWMFAFLLVAAVIVVLMAAFTFLTAAGDPDKTAKARGYITYAIIAIVVGVLAKAIVVLIAGMTGTTVPIIF